MGKVSASVADRGKKGSLWLMGWLLRVPVDGGEEILCLYPREVDSF